MRPIQLSKLSPAGRKLLLVLHIGCSVSWLGVGSTMAVLSLIGLLAQTADLRHAAYAFMHIFDLALVIPLMLVAIGSGLALAIGTPWGLFQYWWIVIKLLLSLAIVGFASAQENFWVRELAEQVPSNLAANPLGGYLAVCMGCFVAALWAATILSIYKPWGRTRWGEAQYLQRKERARR